jgi:hypothetical protein
MALGSLIVVASLAGCTGGSSLFGSLGQSQPTDTPPKAVAEAPVAKVAITSMVGPPDAVAKQLLQEFAGAFEQQRVAVLQRKDGGADFLLRPYILATKEKQGTKISYVMDVSDPNGKKMTRFSGEQRVPPGPTADPWTAVTPDVAKALASKAAGSFAAWLPNAQANLVASNAGPSPSGVSKAAPSSRTAGKRHGTMVSSDQTTGSISKDALTALVPAVSGAPGDGKTSLTAAIQRELVSKGIALADRPSPAAFRVEGIVTMGASREGKQPIQIEWVVKSPQGKKLGTVSQKNEIPEGKLDGAWGSVADQAASAAVVGILKLLPPANEAVN